MRISSAVRGGLQRSGPGKWLSKCLDLRKAYNQIAILPEHRYLAVMSFHDHNGAPRVYVSNSLMFGATAAVYSLVQSICVDLCGFLSTKCYSFLAVFPSMTISPARDADESQMLYWIFLAGGKLALDLRENLSQKSFRFLIADLIYDN